MALIAEAASSLDGALNPQEVKPAPTDAETVKSLEGTANSLQRRRQGTGYGRAVRRPSGCRMRLSSLAKASPEVRSKAEAALIHPPQNYAERYPREP